jgi:hypothetical protein
MRDGPLHERNLEHAALGGFETLSNGFRDFVGFAEAETDPAAAVAYHYNGAEREPPATLYNLGDAADVYYLVNKLKLTGFNG